MTRQLLPVSGYSTNPSTEVTSNAVGIIEFLEIDLPTGPVYLTNAPASYTWGAHTYAPITTTGAPYGSMINYNESTDGIPRPMTLTLSGVDQTLINNLVGNDVQWVPIIWSMGLIDRNNALLNGTPFFTSYQYLGNCTITLGENTGTITIDAENLLADMQGRNSGMFQTVQDQQSRGASGNTTFSTDSFFSFAESIMWMWIYWGQLGPMQVGGGSGPGGIPGAPGPHHNQPVSPIWLP